MRVDFLGLEGVRKVKKYLIFIFLIFLFQTATAFWVKNQIQNQMHTEIRAKCIPFFILPSLYLRDLRFKWHDKIEFLSGDLKVDYSLIPFLEPRLRLKLKGKNLAVRLLGEWARMEGVQSVNLEHLDADLEFRGGVLAEVHSIDARSPSFQFQIKKSEKHKGLSGTSPAKRRSA